MAGSAESCRSVKSCGWAEDIGRREEMEDGFVFVDCFGSKEKSSFFSIYDGHGGRQCVDYVTKYLHEIVLREMARPSCSVPDALMRAFANVDRDMRTGHQLQTPIVNSGCTACVCVLHEDQGRRYIFTAHLGDARAVLCRQGGIAARLTSPSDHKATDPTEMRRVIEAGGAIVNERVNGMLAISRAFGDFQLKMPRLQQDVVSYIPDITSTELTDQDSFVIVACDGVWDVIDDQEAVHIIMEAQTVLQPMLPNGPNMYHYHAKILARALVEEALARGSSDNISALLVNL